MQDKSTVCEKVVCEHCGIDRYFPVEDEVFKYLDNDVPVGPDRFLRIHGKILCKKCRAELGDIISAMNGISFFADRVKELFKKKAEETPTPVEPEREKLPIENPQSFAVQNIKMTPPITDPVSGWGYIGLEITTRTPHQFSGGLGATIDQAKNDGKKLIVMIGTEPESKVSNEPA